MCRAPKGRAGAVDVGLIQDAAHRLTVLGGGGYCSYSNVLWGLDMLQRMCGLESWWW